MLSTLQQMTRRVKKLHGNAGRLTGKLPSPIQAALARGLGYTENYEGLHTHLRLLLAVRKIQNNQLIGSDPVKSRQNFEAEIDSIVTRPTAVSAVQDFVMNTPIGKIPVRLYSPKPSAQPLPLLIFYHGGGFVVGSLNSHDEPCRVICQASGMAVLSVDYRLAPEHKAPAAVQDGVAAFEWAVANAAKLGINPQKIAVGGDSAGGNLSTVVCQQLLSRPTQPAAQLLIYPTVDLAESYPSHQRYSRDLFISQTDMDFIKTMYVGNSGLSLDDPKVSPLYGTLTGLPQAHIVIAEFDVLRDEGLLYAEKLKQAGVTCQVQLVADQGHGFINITSVHQPALTATVQMALALKAMLS